MILFFFHNQDASTTIEEAEVDLVTEEEGVLAQTNVIERETTSASEEDTPLKKIDMPAEEMPHLTEDAAALDQILEIKTAARMKIKEEALINMIHLTTVSETKNTIASQETLLLQAINLSTVEEAMLKVEDSVTDNLAVVSPTVDPIITATVAQIPDIPHLDRTPITETTTAATTPAKATLNSHAVTPVDNVSLCLSVLAEICWS